MASVFIDVIYLFICQYGRKCLIITIRIFPVVKKNSSRRQTRLVPIATYNCNRLMRPLRFLFGLGICMTCWVIHWQPTNVFKGFMLILIRNIIYNLYNNRTIREVDNKNIIGVKGSRSRSLVTLTLWLVHN